MELKSLMQPSPAPTTALLQHLLLPRPQLFCIRRSIKPALAEFLALDVLTQILYVAETPNPRHLAVQR